MTFQSDKEAVTTTSCSSSFTVRPHVTPQLSTNSEEGKSSSRQWLNFSSHAALRIYLVWPYYLLCLSFNMRNFVLWMATKNGSFATPLLVLTCFFTFVTFPFPKPILLSWFPSSYTQTPKSCIQVV